MPETPAFALRGGRHDIALERDRVRRRRVYRLAVTVLVIEAYFAAMPLAGRSPIPALPAVDPLVLVPVLFFTAMLLLLVGSQVVTGRSPHLTYRPEQMDVTLDDVIGIDPCSRTCAARSTSSRPTAGSPSRWVARRGGACSSRVRRERARR